MQKNILNLKGKYGYTLVKSLWEQKSLNEYITSNLEQTSGRISEIANEQLKDNIKNFSNVAGLEAIARNNLKMSGEDEVLVIINSPVKPEVITLNIIDGNFGKKKNSIKKFRIFKF